MSHLDLLRYNYGSASLPELAWTIIGVIGFFFTAGLVLECSADLAALRRSPTYVPHGARHIVARQNLRSMWQRLTLFAGFVAVGLVLCLTPPPGERPTPAALVLGFVFIFSELTLAVGSYQDRKDRDALLKILRVRRADQQMPP